MQSHLDIYFSKFLQLSNNLISSEYIEKKNNDNENINAEVVNKINAKSFGHILLIIPPVVQQANVTVVDFTFPQRFKTIFFDFLLQAP